MNDKKYLTYTIMDKLLFSKFSDIRCKALYEAFLLDVVNNSNYFLKKSNNEKYFLPKCESNGECDCNTENYKFDFKLLISESYMEGKSISSKSYTYLPNGVCLMHLGKKEPKYKHIGLIHKELSNHYDYNLKFIENDINSIKEIFKVHKHLLLFLPYKFSFNNNKDLYNEKDINKLLTEGIITKLIEYKSECINNFDTYFVYLFNEYAIINIINEIGSSFIEKINLNNNIIYNKLYK